MFILIIVLTALCVFVEIQLMEKLPWLESFLEKLGPIGTLAFSLGMSIMLGSVFGAAGLICFCAGICSTVFVQPYYRMKKSGQWDAYAEKLASTKKQFNANKDLYVHRMQQFMSVCKALFAIVALPFKALFAIMDGVEAAKAKVNNVTNKARR